MTSDPDTSRIVSEGKDLLTRYKKYGIQKVTTTTPPPWSTAKPEVIHVSLVKEPEWRTEK